MNYPLFILLASILAVCGTNIMLLVHCKQASNVFQSRPPATTFNWWPWRK